MKMNATRKFRELLKSKDHIVIVGAHNALSAKLIQKAGFDGIWASSFEISASFGIPDANLLTFGEILSIIRSMSEEVDLPIIVDADNGFGDAMNLQRAIKQLERIEVAGICFEDKPFPKRNSFYSKKMQKLEDIKTFVGKIKAAIDARCNKDFVIIARTEALITGHGIEEALLRAGGYADAGADMILIHSKSKEGKDIINFAKQWKRNTPLVAIPTTYDHLSAKDLNKLGFKMTIFANQGIRAAVKAVEDILRVLKDTNNASKLKKHICDVEHIFSIVGYPNFKEKEAKYVR